MDTGTMVTWERECVFLAALTVARKEKWRRKAIWSRVQEFSALTQMPITSYIISIVVGSEEMAVSGGRYMLKCGFHVVQIRPPAVAPNSCRLRVSLSATHTTDDIKRLTDALSQFMKLLHDNGKSSGVTVYKALRVLGLFATISPTRIDWGFIFS